MGGSTQEASCRYDPPKAFQNRQHIAHIHQPTLYMFGFPAPLTGRRVFNPSSTVGNMHKNSTRVRLDGNGMHKTCCTLRLTVMFFSPKAGLLSALSFAAAFAFNRSAPPPLLRYKQKLMSPVGFNPERMFDPAGA